MRQRAVRERRAREAAEALLEEKSRELYCINQDLEVRVAERTAELEEARQAAEAASRAKSSFLAVMSHEIRTPMNAVLGLSSSLLESDLPEEKLKLVRTIYEAGDNLLEILNDILDYSKLEAGELTFEAIAFAPRDIVEGAVSIIEPRAAAKGLKVTANFAPDLPQALLGDAGRLRQVLLNLLSNAVKFTSSGSVVVSADCRERDSQRATIDWAVTDTGMGIASDRVGQLFKDFAQADCSINRRFGGSGLGLSICKRIIDKMGGEIGIVSAPGQGTTVRFTTTMQVTELSSASDIQDCADAALEAYVAVLGRPLRILIADDNSTNRLVAAKMLQSANVQTNMAGDGTEAVTAAGSFPYDLILMDVRMPEMDGLEATRTLRRRGIVVPVVGFTANAFDDDIKACLDAGMNGFVAKPVRKKALFDAVVRAIKAHAKTVALPGAFHRDAARASHLSAPPAIGDALDWTAYNALKEELGAEGMQEAVTAFLDEMAGRLKFLRQCPLEQDRSSLSREAHTIKGTSGTFGFQRTSELAKWLERNADKVTAEELADLSKRLEAAFEEARGLLPN